MPVTLKDVAARAGVSTSAVSRTFTPGASVSPATRAKVEAAAAALGYTPSALASGLATGRTKLIGLVVSNFQNPVFLEVFERFTLKLQGLGLRPLLVNLTGQTDPEASVQMLRQYSVDAVVLTSSTMPPSFAAAFRAAGLQVVHCFGRATHQPETHVVGIDNRACGRLAAETLLARGYRKLGFLGGPVGATSTEDRLTGFREALGDIAPASVSFATAYGYEAGQAEMRRLIAAGPLAEAYLCGDDVLSLGVLDALRSTGIDVPGDVGLLGVNGMQMTGWDAFNLTTIRQPMEAIIDASIELALASIDTPDMAPEMRLFDGAVVERGTLRPLP